MVFASCEFKPKDDYFVNLSAKPPAEVSIAIPGHSDTLIIISYTNYNVKVTCSNNRSVLFHRMYIDSELKYTQASGANFYINPLQYIQHDGIYRMIIEVGCNTGSGSIAESVGAEGYLFQQEFILMLFHEQVAFYPDLKFDRSNGTMKVSMDVPLNVTNIKKVGFSKYVGMVPGFLVAEVAGTNHYETIDPMYVGEWTSYAVQTYIGDSAGTIFFPFVNGGNSVSPDLPEISAGTTAKGFPLLRWDKTHYPANCGSYRVYATPYINSERQLLGTVSNINDTVYDTEGVAFPGAFTFRVASVPLNIPSWYTDEVACEYYASGIYTNVGLASFSFTGFQSPSCPFIYYTSSSNTINEYSIETESITNVISTSTGWFYTFAVSPNGKYLLAATGASNFLYMFCDLTTHQATLVPSSQVIGAGAGTGIVSVADNGLASIITGTKFVVYDFLHQNPVAQQALPTWGDRTVISADGQYVFTAAGDLYLYKLVSGSLEQKWVSSSQPGTFKYYAFDPASPSTAKIFIDQTLYTKNCETWATEGSFLLDLDMICNIDFANGHLLGKKATQFKVYDPNTGSLQFQNATENSSLTYDLRIKKNSVYHTSGKKLIIF